MTFFSLPIPFPSIYFAEEGSKSLGSLHWGPIVAFEGSNSTSTIGISSTMACFSHFLKSAFKSDLDRLYLSNSCFNSSTFIVSIWSLLKNINFDELGTTRNFINTILKVLNSLSFTHGESFPSESQQSTSSASERVNSVSKYSINDCLWVDSWGCWKTHLLLESMASQLMGTSFLKQKLDIYIYQKLSINYSEMEQGQYVFIYICKLAYIFICVCILIIYTYINI